MHGKVHTFFFEIWWFRSRSIWNLFKTIAFLSFFFTWYVMCVDVCKKKTRVSLLTKKHSVYQFYCNYFLLPLCYVFVTMCMIFSNPFFFLQKRYKHFKYRGRNYLIFFSSYNDLIFTDCRKYGSWMIYRWLSHSKNVYIRFKSVQTVVKIFKNFPIFFFFKHY